MWKINGSATYYAILWSRRRNRYSGWTWLKIARSHMVEIANWIRWSIASPLCNFNSIESFIWKRQSYININYLSSQNGISVLICSTIIKQAGNICRIWRWSIVRRAKAKNCNCKSNIEETKNNVAGRSNFSSWSS